MICTSLFLPIIITPSIQNHSCPYADLGLQASASHLLLESASFPDYQHNAAQAFRISKLKNETKK